MRTVYHLPHHPPGTLARCKQVALNTWDLCSLQVDICARGRGFGNELLKWVLEDADREGVALWLQVASFGVMSDFDLFRWYSRNGFVQRTGWYMQRPPQPIAQDIGFLNPTQIQKYAPL